MVPIQKKGFRFRENVFGSLGTCFRMYSGATFSIKFLIFPCCGSLLVCFLRVQEHVFAASSAAAAAAKLLLNCNCCCC